MAGPPKQFDCEQVLGRAMEIFWAKGYEATSMQDLVDGMGISRASMYNTFGGKRDIFRLVLRDYARSGLEHLEQVFTVSGSARAKLKKFLEIFLSGSGTSGCLIGNAAVELGPHDGQIAATIRNFWSEVEARLTDLLDEGIRAGEFPEALEPRVCARLINCQVQGLVMMSKAGVGKPALLEVAGQLIRLLEHQQA